MVDDDDEGSNSDVTDDDDNDETNDDDDDDDETTKTVTRRMIVRSIAAVAMTPMMVTHTAMTQDRAFHRFEFAHCAAAEHSDARSMVFCSYQTIRRIRVPVATTVRHVPSWQVAMWRMRRCIVPADGRTHTVTDGQDESALPPTLLFLLNTSESTIHGVFVADSDPGSDLDAGAERTLSRAGACSNARSAL